MMNVNVNLFWGAVCVSVLLPFGSPPDDCPVVGTHPTNAAPGRGLADASIASRPDVAGLLPTYRMGVE